VGFKLASKEVVKLLDAHSALGYLLPHGGHDFGNRRAGHGVLNEVGRDGGNVLPAVSGLLGELGPRTF